jgi:uncharacterized protein YoxC
MQSEDCEKYPKIRKKMTTHVVVMVAIGIVLAFVFAYGIQVDKTSRRIKELEELNARQQSQIEALTHELEELKSKKLTTNH